MLEISTCGVKRKTKPWPVRVRLEVCSAMEKMNPIRQVRVGLIYLLAGLGGSLMSSLFLQNSISVGASGALFRLLGAMLSKLLINWTIYSNKAAALFTLVIVIAVNLAVGLLPHVDNFAHIGGFFLMSITLRTLRTSSSCR